MERSCALCGVDITGLHGLRTKCESCAPRRVDARRRYVPSVKQTRACDACDSTFETHMSSRRWCSDKCRQTTRMRPCAGCGKLIHHTRTSGAISTCLDCRRSQAKRPEIDTWNCADCGTPCSRKPTKGQRPKWCEDCRKKSRARDWIPRTVRLGIYERDGWTCWLCREIVDARLIGTRSPWRASLDHVRPRSLGGSNDPENLKLAHVWCNTTRNDGRAYSPEDFRVAV